MSSPSAPSSTLVQYPGPGCIVEFLQGNAPQIAWVMEEQSGKLRLMLPNRREMPLAANRLLPWSGPRYEVSGRSREDIVALLNKHREIREARMAETDAVELWGLVEGEMEKSSASWLAELSLADPTVDDIAACGHALLGCKSHFKFQPPDFEIFSAEAVESRQQQEEAARQREAMVGGGAEWFRLLWEARLNRKACPAENLEPPEPVRSRLKRLLMARIADPDTQEDEHLWKQVSKALPDDPHVPLLLAITWNLLPEHYNFWMDRANYSPGNDWANEFQEEVAHLLAPLHAEREYSAQPFLSIDSPTTRDIDDAFWVESTPEGWHVVVALACPALYWPFESELGKAVARRATSLYLPEGDHHMMPEALGVNGYSLWAGQGRPALLVHCQVRNDGSLGDPAMGAVKPELAWVQVTANLSYEACEEVFNAQAKSEAANPATAFAEVLEAGLALARARLNYRIREGAVVIDRPDPVLSLSGEGADVQVSLTDSSNTPAAQLLVSELMILANTAVAAWGSAHEVPLLYRTQDVALPKEYAGQWNAPEDIARVVRAMAPAVLDCVPRPHAGMGLNAYSPLTSPLRRYTDLMNEAQVLHYLEKGSPRWSQDEIREFLPVLGTRLDLAGQVQRFRPRYWKLVYIQQQSRLDPEACMWDAVVTEENDMFVFISLPREQVQLRGKRNLFGEKVALGQRVKVRLGKINPLRNDIQIMAVSEE